jgi:acetyl esterase/lipase
VLISPGLDASISRPEHMEIAARDPVQDIPGILEGARLYAGDLDVSHPYVSPLNGDFSGLAPMIVFSGTLDLLYPDSIELDAKARAAGGCAGRASSAAGPATQLCGTADAGRPAGACDHPARRRPGTEVIAVTKGQA